MEGNWWGTYNAHEKQYIHLFDKATSSRAYEEFVQSTSFPLVPVKPQGQGITYASHQQGYVTRAVHVTRAMGVAVTEEEIDDNLYKDKAFDRTAMLAFSFNQTKEVDGANQYNRAFNSIYVFGDGKEMCATDHPNSTGGTYSNELAVGAALSELAIEDLITQIMGAQNDNGLQISLMPRSLIVPRQLWAEAARILKSINQSNSIENNLNVLRSMNMLPEGHHVNHYLDDANNWFIRTNAPKGAMYIERKAITFSKDNDFGTGNALMKASERYVFTIADPRSVYGSAPA